MNRSFTKLEIDAPEYLVVFSVIVVSKLLSFTEGLSSSLENMM